MRRLDAVIDGVAQHVQQRVGELLQDRAVELDLGAADLHLDLLAELARDVARGARQPLGDERERRHPHRHHLVVQVLHDRVEPVHALVEGRARVLRERPAHLADARGGEDELAHRVEEAVEDLGAHAHRAARLARLRPRGRARAGRHGGALRLRPRAA